MNNQTPDVPSITQSARGIADLEVSHQALKSHIEKLQEALHKIDTLGNGLSMQEDEQGLTSYATLMRCGSIARAALKQSKP